MSYLAIPCDAGDADSAFATLVVNASDYDALKAENDDLLKSGFAQAAVIIENRGLRAENERLRADAKAGWDAFYKLRKSVADERYPGMTGVIVPKESSDNSGASDG